MNSDISRGWVIKDASGNTRGFLGNIPVKYQINKEEKIVCSARSRYVDKEYIDQSLQLLNFFGIL